MLFIVDGLDAFLPLVMKEVIDALNSGASRAQLGRLSLTYLIIASVQCLGRFTWRILLGKTSATSGRTLRSRFHGHVLQLPKAFFDRRSGGELTALATNDAEAATMIFGYGAVIFLDAAFYLATIPLAMAYLSPRLAMMVIAPLFLIPFLVLRREKVIQKKFSAVQESFSHLSSITEEAFHGIRTLKSFSREKEACARYRASSAGYRERSLELARVDFLFGPSLEAVVCISIALLLFVGGRDVLAGALSIGGLLAMLRYLQQLLWPMQAVGSAVSVYKRAVASALRLEAIFETPVEANDEPRGSAGRSAQTHRSPPPGIEIERVSFGYEGGAADVLKDLTLRIEPGERIAVVGPIGCGKSTLLSLLAGLYAPTTGCIRLIGGEAPAKEALRKHAALASQPPFLFSGSAAYNLQLGASPGALFSSDDMARVLKDTFIFDEFSALEEGVDAPLGERGASLSGGQRQRLSLARSLLANRPLLLLDDPLSSLDSETERDIVATLARIDRSRTLVFSSHRLALVRQADKIVVLNDGTIAAMGNHEELLAKDEWYREFVLTQRLREELDEYAAHLA